MGMKEKSGGGGAVVVRREEYEFRILREKRRIEYLLIGV